MKQSAYVHVAASRLSVARKERQRMQRTLTERRARYMRMSPQVKRMLDLHIMAMLNIFEKARFQSMQRAFSRMRLAKMEKKDTFCRARFERRIQAVHQREFVALHGAWSSWYRMYHRRRHVRAALNNMCEKFDRVRLSLAFGPWAAHKRAVAACVLICRKLATEGTGVAAAWRQWRRVYHRGTCVGAALMQAAKDADADLAPGVLDNAMLSPVVSQSCQVVALTQDWLTLRRQQRAWRIWLHRVAIARDKEQHLAIYSRQCQLRGRRLMTVSRRLVATRLVLPRLLLWQRMVKAARTKAEADMVALRVLKRVLVSAIQRNSAKVRGVSARAFWRWAQASWKLACAMRDKADAERSMHLEQTASAQREAWKQKEQYWREAVQRRAATAANIIASCVCDGRITRFRSVRCGDEAEVSLPQSNKDEALFAVSSPEVTGNLCKLLQYIGCNVFDIVANGDIMPGVNSSFDCGTDENAEVSTERYSAADTEQDEEERWESNLHLQLKVLHASSCLVVTEKDERYVHRAIALAATLRRSARRRRQSVLRHHGQQQVQQAADAAVEFVVGTDMDSVESELDSDDDIVHTATDSDAIPASFFHGQSGFSVSGARGASKYTWDAWIKGGIKRCRHASAAASSGALALRGNVGIIVAAATVAAEDVAQRYITAHTLRMTRVSVPETDSADAARTMADAIAAVAAQADEGAAADATMHALTAFVTALGKLVTHTASTVKVTSSKDRAILAEHAAWRGGRAIARTMLRVATSATVFTPALHAAADAVAMVDVGCANESAKSSREHLVAHARSQMNIGTGSTKLDKTVDARASAKAAAKARARAKRTQANALSKRNVDASRQLTHDVAASQVSVTPGLSQVVGRIAWAAGTVGTTAVKPKAFDAEQKKECLLLCAIASGAAVARVADHAAREAYRRSSDNVVQWANCNALARLGARAVLDVFADRSEVVQNSSDQDDRTRTVLVAAVTAAACGQHWRRISNSSSSETTTFKIGEGDRDLSGCRDADDDISGNDGDEMYGVDMHKQPCIGCLPLEILRQFMGCKNGSNSLACVGQLSTVELAPVIECLLAAFHVASDILPKQDARAHELAQRTAQNQFAKQLQQAINHAESIAANQLSLVEQEWQQRVNTFSRFATRTIVNRWYHTRVKIPFQMWHQTVMIQKERAFRKELAARAILQRASARKAVAFRLWYQHAVPIRSMHQHANTKSNSAIRRRNLHFNCDGSAPTDFDDRYHVRLDNGLNRPRVAGGSAAPVRILRHMLYHSCSVAWEQWVVVTRSWQRTKQFVARLLHCSLSQAWSQWKFQVVVKQQASSRLDKEHVRAIISRWSRLPLIKAMRQWQMQYWKMLWQKQWIQEMSFLHFRQVTKAKSALRRMLHRPLATAWIKWYDLANARRRGRLLMREAMQRLYLQRFEFAWQQWITVLQTDLRMRAFMNKMLNRSLHAGWTQWKHHYVVSCAFEKNSQERKMQNAIMQWLRRLLSHYFIAWRMLGLKQKCMRRFAFKFAHHFQKLGWDRWRIVHIECKAREHQVEARKFGLLLVCRLSRHYNCEHLQAAFTLWMSTAAKLSRRGILVVRITQRNRLYRLQEAFARWNLAILSDALLARSQSFVTRTVVSRWQHGLKHSAWCCWCARVRESVHITKLIKRLRIRHMTRYWVLWKHNSAILVAQTMFESTRQRQVLRRAAWHWRSRAVLYAWSTWRDFMKQTRQMFIFLKRLANRVLATGFIQLRHVAFARDRLRRATLSVLTNGKRRRQKAAWSRWQKQTQSSVMISRVLTRMFHRAIAKVWNSWKHRHTHWLRSSARCKNLVAKYVSRMQNMLLVQAWLSWWRVTRREKHVLEQMRALFGRRKSRQFRRVWRCWYTQTSLARKFAARNNYRHKALRIVQICMVKVRTVQVWKIWRSQVQCAQSLQRSMHRLRKQVLLKGWLWWEKCDGYVQRTQRLNEQRAKSLKFIVLRKVRSMIAMVWHMLRFAHLQAKMIQRHSTTVKQRLLTSLALHRSHNIIIKAWNRWHAVLALARAEDEASKQQAAAQASASKQDVELHRLRSALEEARRQAAEQCARAEHNAALLEHCRDVCAQQQAELEVMSADNEGLRRASARRQKAAAARKKRDLSDCFSDVRSFIRPSVPPSPSIPFSQTPIPVRPETTELYQWDKHPVPDPVSGGTRDEGARTRSKDIQTPTHMLPTVSSKAKVRYGFELTM